jgi:hypothetical protein
MTYSVITLPQTILCGKCGHHMRADDTFQLGKPVILRCEYYQCENRGIALEFPVTPIEIESSSGVTNAPR